MKTILLLFILIALQLNAQFTIYTPENSELPSHNISNIIVDFDNVLWLGSGENLVKFEDNKFTIYNSSNSELPTEAIIDMYLDSKGVLWILYTNYIYKKQNTKIEFVKSIDYGKKIAVDRNGDVIFGSNMSLLKLNSDLIVDTLFKSEMLDHKPVSEIIIDNSNTIWFVRGFEDGIRKVFKDSTFYYGRENTEFQFSFISHIALDSSNNIWLGGNRQLFKYNQAEDEWTDIIKEYSEILDETWAYSSIAFNQYNTPFITSRNAIRTHSKTLFLYKLKENSLTSFQLDSFFIDDEFKPKILFPMAIDLNDSVWIRISDVGLLKFDPSISSVNLLQNSKYTIFPNPIINTVNIDFENEVLITNYKVSNVMGKTVLVGELIPSSSIKIDVEKLPVGMYIIELYETSNIVVFDKFVKE